VHASAEVKKHPNLAKSNNESLCLVVTSAAQVLPLAQLSHLLAFFFRMMEFFFRITQNQAIADGPSFQEPKCCSSASVGPAASFVGILFPNRLKTSHR